MANIITMTNPSINGGTPVKLLNGEISYSWQNLVSVDPTNSAFDITEVQFSGWENPTINLSFHIPIDSNPSGFMTWLLWNSFAKNEYDGTSATRNTLQLVVGDTDTSLVSYATTSSTASIPFQVKAYTLRFGASVSHKANFWTIDAQIVETK